jgi:hypothetical protein
MPNQVLDQSPAAESSVRTSARPDAVPTRLDDLRALEAESVHILREVVAELERPVQLFSGEDPAGARSR